MIALASNPRVTRQHASPGSLLRPISAKSERGVTDLCDTRGDRPFPLDVPKFGYRNAPEIGCTLGYKKA